MAAVKPPTFRHLPPGVRDPADGCTLVEAEALIAMLQAVGKTSGGAASQLLMALGVLLVDTRPPGEIDGVIDHTPQLLRQCVAQVQRERADAEQH